MGALSSGIPALIPIKEFTLNGHGGYKHPDKIMEKFQVVQKKNDRKIYCKISYLGIYRRLKIRAEKKELIAIINAPNGIWTRVTSSTGSYDRPLHYRGFPH